MITVLRNYFKRGSQIILWIIILTFVVGLLPLALRQVTGSKWAIRVNGQDVGYQEYLLEYERWKERMAMARAQFGEYADILLAQMGIESPQSEAVQSLARQELLNQFADSIGLQVSPEFVTQKMSDPTYVLQALGDLVPRQLVDPMTGIDQTMLKRYLKHFDLSVDMFERIVEKTLTDRFVTDLLKSSFYLPRFDEKQNYIAQHAKKKFSVLVLPIKKVLEEEKKSEVANEALKRFYDAHSQRYTVPEKRTGMMWEFDPLSYNISISSKQIEEYYENNKVKMFIDSPAKVTVRRILFAVSNDAELPSAQAKADRIKGEVARDSSKFADVAKRVSEDRETAESGGLMEPFTRGTHEVAFDRTAFLLKEDEEVSEVIRTKDGYEILQRVSKMPQTFKSLSSVKTDIKETLLEKEFRIRFSNDMRKVIDQEESLAAFIKKRGGAPSELERVALDDTPATQHIFKLQPGRQTFFVDSNKGIALRLDSIQERFIPTLDAVKSTVTEDLQEERAQEKLEERLKEAKKEMENASLDALKKQFDAEGFESGWVDPQDAKDTEKLKKKELPVDQMLQMEKVGALIASRGLDRGFVVRLDTIEPLGEQEYQAKLGTDEQSFEDRRMGQYLQGFVDSLYRNANIETNESIITLEE